MSDHCVCFREQSRLFVTVLTLFSLILIVACAPQKPPPSQTSDPQVYQAVGRVVSMNKEQGSVELDHEDIKGVMPAMKMEFYV